MVLVILLASAGIASAMPASPQPFKHTQPNGEVVELKIKGSPGDHWATDMNDYTVLLNDDGAYVFAQENGQGGLEATTELVQANSKGPYVTSPSTTSGMQQNGPKKDIRPAHKDCKPDMFCFDLVEHDTLTETIAGYMDTTNGNNRKLWGRIHPKTGRELRSALSDVKRSLEEKTDPTGGKLRNLVLMMRWSDHEVRVLPTPEQVDILMNHEGPHALAPTGSVRDVFLENSYGNLDLESVVIGWIPMSKSEQYYTNGESGLILRFHEAISEALQYADSNNLVDFDYFDADNNGQIDAITFLHSGYAAEFGGIDQFGQEQDDRVWSHKWRLQQAFMSKTGVQVNDYHVSSAVWGTSGSAIGRIGVIAHETGHFLGMPDLYDRDGGGSGLGTWGLMGNSWGFDGSQYYPPHGSSFLKQELGWMEAHAPQPGTNLIEHTESQNPTHQQLYRIDHGFPDGEYLLIENRQPHGYNSIVPQGGLVIYHIDEKAELYTEGHPGQEDWPENGNHYAIAVAQADGRYHLERRNNLGDGGDVFHGAGVNFLTPCFEGVSCRYPNTDSYQNGIVNRTNVQITDISRSSNVMTFHYQVFGAPVPTSLPSSAPSASPSFTLENGLESGAAALFLAGGLALLKNTPFLLGMATTLATLAASAIA